ncbi:hypothetical protein GCM10012290_22540 [Halolactibacillus alkaliphilus]|uniref:GGDEF domain-containing protein n=1 Tax=Halolactibacillus alkaliphilus TaxID=442899 RepID=A0A511X3Y7_9BACI|nr:GGDEF domain-containing protein [Halolactibacillus alkaliphilus]GEN57654.1 hypothetical protein HAL01_21180 [Halolactibacillus alkaliphilus]GGN74536.1 hypothetical protein GCM10012290_22540 [Halolactibacillus alkaliphilus]SFP02206.1 diguanylate cyclase (GGDEF) domain-containing protein [Halolactibacillus alkaliphilus]
MNQVTRRKRRWRLIYIFLLLTLLVYIFSRAFHIEIRTKEPLTFLGNEDLAPVSYTDNGEAKGVVVDIVEALGVQIDRDIEVITMDWEEAQLNVLNGDADGLLYMNENEARQHMFDFSDPFLETEFHFFVRSSDRSIQNVNDLRNKRVGLEQVGYPYVVLQNHSDINSVFISNWRTAFQQLADGELDALVVDRWVGEYELAESRISGIRIVEEPFAVQRTGIAIRKNEDLLLEELNGAIKSITDSGELPQILDRWGGKRVIYLTEERFKYYMLLGVTLFLGIIVIGVSFFIFNLGQMNKHLTQEVERRTLELKNKNKALETLNYELQQISLVDKLTNIANRRHLDSELEKSWAIKMDEEQPLAIIMIDIDHFKTFNDLYGHVAGDTCLNKVANTLSSCVIRAGDLVARYGGEEFMVMLLRATSSDAYNMAESMRKKVEQLEIKNGQGQVTISLGVASMIPSKGRMLSDLVYMADRALYIAKQEGRNRVRIAREEDEKTSQDTK